MSQIRILSEHLANQIAAGEVVERPASVVKELLENSLDAGADRVDIQVEGGGTRLIRIVDNGLGMDGDDVLLSLERHATSKLTDESQLGAIATLGFRGEALPSIGSVSRMTILSRIRQAATGTRADIRYGTLHGVHEDGCARGTLIEVRSLFGNLPARKKFLKTNRTELSHIDEVIRGQSLAHPHVAFSLQVEGRKVFDFPATDLEQRVRDVFRYQDTLLPVQAAIDDEEGLQVSGFLLLPDAAPSARLRILVNSRPVQDRMIRHAVMEGLQGFLMKGHQPAGALLLEVAPELVDVNVHPAKREIRFRNAREVHRFIVRAVARAIQQHQDQVRSELFSIPEHGAAVAPGPGTSAFVDNQPRQPAHQQIVPMGPGTDSPDARTMEPATDVLLNDEPVRPQPVVCQPGKQAEFSGLTLIGQFLQLYLLCERDGQLVVIDQHAAHERILYQRLRHGYEQREIPSQSLMFPVTIELGPDHAETLEKETEAVAALGVQVEFFGDTTWVIKAVPALVSQLSPQDVLADILDGLRNRSSTGLSGVVPECIDNLLASMACKAAIKAGDSLQPEEMIELLQQMENSQVFSHCPHGRPVIKTFSRQEIEKWFHRT
ncbi:MAG: DNA mismatch repair endonuclease MutL [Thermodesulfobacteriota bacterium]|nr:DNA mismatch repair endonuclease MutL [Thermodesulfobacteriota bacterium]